MDDESHSTDRSPRVLLAGGGSGGHVFPALAVGEVLTGRGWTVHWAGRAGSMEERLVTGRGIPFHAVAARAVVGSGALARARALGTVAVSAVRCRSMVRRLGIHSVVGTGGYVSVPVVLGARAAGRPSILLEPNADAGVANRFLSRWASAAAVAHPVTGEGLRCRAVPTGVPVRRAFFEIPDLEPGGRLRVLVLGGSQGAQQLNNLIPAAFAAARLAAEIRHQAGGGAEEGTRAAWAERAVPGVEVAVTPFIEDVAGALAWAHLVISRAGAITVAEICAAGRPSILVPLRAAGGHQRANAQAVAAAGGAVVLEGDAASAERLAPQLRALGGDPDRLMKMARAARSLARPQAAEGIADLVESLEVAS